MQFMCMKKWRKLQDKKCSQRFEDKQLRMREILHFFTRIKYNIGLLGIIWIWEHMGANLVSAILKQVTLNLFGEMGSFTNIWEILL